MNEFLIKSEKEVSLTFHSRQFREDGWLQSYSISAVASNFSAVICAENPPYGSSPAEFFQELANNWAGWKGEKRWGALDGEYNLWASSDMTGHITLVAQFNPFDVAPCYSSTLSLVVEAGQLEQVASRAKLFFGTRA